MKPYLLDIIVSPAEILIREIANHSGAIFLLLIVFLVLAVVLVNVFVIKKAKKRDDNEQTEVQYDESGDNE